MLIMHLKNKNILKINERTQLILFLPLSLIIAHFSLIFKINIHKELLNIYVGMIFVRHPMWV